jgi:acetoin utilization deacetylase AcuC-like enzyme
MYIYNAYTHTHTHTHRYGSLEFREAVEKMLEKLAAFKPDLLVVSAGFDAHEQDKMNYGVFVCV